MKKHLFKSDIYLVNRNKKFSIVNNLPNDISELSITAAAENWQARTKEFTAKNFVEYLREKLEGTEYFAYTMSEYNKNKAKIHKQFHEN